MFTISLRLKVLCDVHTNDVTTCKEAKPRCSIRGSRRRVSVEAYAILLLVLVENVSYIRQTTQPRGSIVCAAIAAMKSVSKEEKGRPPSLTKVAIVSYH